LPDTKKIAASVGAAEGCDLFFTAQKNREITRRDFPVNIHEYMQSL
jgi:hypothetical protein